MGANDKDVMIFEGGSRRVYFRYEELFDAVANVETVPRCACGMVDHLLIRFITIGALVHCAQCDPDARSPHLLRYGQPQGRFSEYHQMREERLASSLEENGPHPGAQTFSELLDQVERDGRFDPAKTEVDLVRDLIAMHPIEDIGVDALLYCAKVHIAIWTGRDRIPCC